MAMLIICWLCALIFLGIGLYASRAKKPMHFWTGTTVKAEEIRDIPAYNQANGIMWMVYGMLFIIGGLLSLYSIEVAGIFVGIVSFGGIGVLIFIYSRIYKKYKM